MAYLTYDEYKNLGFADIDQTEFDKLLKKAEDVLDSVTRSFYRFHDLETDIPFRRDKFKKALACQIESSISTTSERQAHTRSTIRLPSKSAGRRFLQAKQTKRKPTPSLRRTSTFI